MLFHARMSNTCLTYLPFGSRKTRCDLLVVLGRLPVTTAIKLYCSFGASEDSEAPDRQEDVAFSHLFPMEHWRSTGVYHSRGTNAVAKLYLNLVDAFFSTFHSFDSISACFCVSPLGFQSTQCDLLIQVELRWHQVMKKRCHALVTGLCCFR